MPKLRAGGAVQNAQRTHFHSYLLDTADSDGGQQASAGVRELPRALLRLVGMHTKRRVAGGENLVSRRKRSVWPAWFGLKRLLWAVALGTCLLASCATEPFAQP